MQYAAVMHQIHSRIYIDALRNFNGAKWDSQNIMVLMRSVQRKGLFGRWMRIVLA